MEMNRHEENLIKIFEGQKSKINWDYLMSKFSKEKIPESFKNHFNKEIKQCSF